LDSKGNGPNRPETWDSHNVVSVPLNRGGGASGSNWAVWSEWGGWLGKRELIRGAATPLSSVFTGS